MAEKGSLKRLDDTIGVLAEAVQPLQGASERVGRLVDRLPERRRRGRDGSGDDADGEGEERPDQGAPPSS